MHTMMIEMPNAIATPRIPPCIPPTIIAVATMAAPVIIIQFNLCSLLSEAAAIYTLTSSRTRQKAATPPPRMLE